ncbi:MAG: hypothetical protein AAFQ96_07065, partial [Pseudomonadota bacterium]
MTEFADLIARVARTGVFSLVLVAAAGATGFYGGAAADETEAATGDEDPFLWLEDVEGDKALTWVRDQNKRSLAVLQEDPYQALYE